MPDTTLGNNSRVTTNVQIRGADADLIEGGVNNGGNLFHSFLEFSVDEGQRVYFANPNGIESILSRVTGESQSTISGTLGVDGSADLFFLNPNGIVFEEGAALDIDGSFYATTAEAIELGEGIFSATEPGKSTLLAVNPNVNFSNYLTDTSGDIASQADLLAVGGNLTLTADDLEIEASTISAEEDLSLHATNDISINGSFLLTLNGDIDIKATNFDLLNGTFLKTGFSFRNNESSFISHPSNITIDITGILTMNNVMKANPEPPSSSIDTGAVGATRGDAGDIYIAAGGIIMDDGARINTSAIQSPSGDAGSINITTTGSIIMNAASSIAADTDGTGDAGNITVIATQLQLLNDSRITSGGVPGGGEGGDVTLDIAGTAYFEGGSFEGTGGVSTRTLGEGMGGDISIRATNLVVSNGAILSTATAGSGNAGNITLGISETARIGDGKPTLSPDITGFSSILTNVEKGATGNGGRLWINAGNLEVIGAAQLVSSLAGNDGAAGDIILDADSVIIQGGKVISDIQTMSNGVSGDIFVTADSFIMTDGGALDASVSGEGKAGDIILLITENAYLEGTQPGGFPTEIRSAIEPEAIGTGGTITINAGELNVLAGAQLVNTVFGTGDAGNIILNIRETARFSGANPVKPDFSSGVFGSTEGNGNGGDLLITANDLEIMDNAILSTASFEAGSAADIFINLRGQLIMRDSEIKAASVETSGANIEIVASAIRLLEDSDIRTDVETGEGRGGNITLTADTIVALNDSDILAFSADGEGGNVLLNTPAFFGENFQPAPQLRTREELESLDGNERVDVNATGRIASGTIAIPEANFIENSLSELSSNLVNTETLIASSCVTRRNNVEGSFIITEGDGLAQKPGGESVSTYSTSPIQSIPGDNVFQILQEPESIYQLANGRLVLSREC